MVFNRLPTAHCLLLTAMMQGEIITTGDELLTGRIGDFNARYAARRLHEAGLTVQRLTILGDHSPLFQDLLAEALARSQFIIITGGLGPTEDDITVAAAAQALNLRLLCDEVLLERIRRCLGERRIPWDERYARLALIPEGAQVLDPGGMACGFALKHGGTRLFFLPGVPKEMRLLFDGLVLPALVESAGGGDRLAQRTLRLFGISEARLQQVVSHLPDFRPGEVTAGFYPNFPETHLTLTMRGRDRQALEETLDRLTSALAREVGDVLLGSDLISLEGLVGRYLQKNGLTLAVAESCTGGLIGHRLTEVPGASDYFLGGRGELQQRRQVRPAAGAGRGPGPARGGEPGDRPGHGPGGQRGLSRRHRPGGDRHRRPQRRQR